MEGFDAFGIDHIVSKRSSLFNFAREALKESFKAEKGWRASFALQTPNSSTILLLLVLLLCMSTPTSITAICKWGASTPPQPPLDPPLFF